MGWCAAAGGVLGQELPVWDPAVSGRSGAGQWAVNRVSTAWARVQATDGWSMWEAHAPLRPAGCWSVRTGGGQAGRVWSAWGLQVAHERSLGSGWDARIALGGMREAWPDVGRFRWRPEAALALTFRSGEWSASGWSEVRMASQDAFPHSGVVVAGHWESWQASVFTSSSGGHGGWVQRPLSGAWSAGAGWSHAPFCFLVGLGCGLGRSGWGQWCRGESGWGASRWMGYVAKS